ncbi:protein-tyrosine phosphatase-like protein [Pelagophyceae sp. CCMP2097]|nr:protein-tyrosine phosphatase-like protein [Pelagophyceae sp. CCMP2097]
MTSYSGQGTPKASARLRRASSSPRDRAGSTEPLHPVPAADWPYVWALRDLAQLDWAVCVSEADRPAIVKAQFRLPVAISETILLGDSAVALDVPKLQQLGISHVVNAAALELQSPFRAYEAAGIQVLSVAADDDGDYDVLGAHLANVRDFIESARRAGGKVLLHCIAGLNRSGVLVAAEYMLAGRVDLLRAVAHCRLQRGNEFLNNKAFQVALVALARREGLLGAVPGATGSRAANEAPPMPPPAAASTRGRSVSLWVQVRRAGFVSLWVQMRRAVGLRR